MAKQMCHKNQCLGGEKPVSNNQDKPCHKESKKMKSWVDYKKALLNEEFPWDDGALPDAFPIEGPPPPISD